MTSPDPFDGIVGHADLVARLRALLHGGRIGLPVLLVGEEGRGKRTVVHALARALLVGAAPKGEVARARKLVDGGNHPGLIHVEPLRDERFHPVRRIRRLLESCALKVGFGDRRVVVLARLHAVNEESGNTLLKFLEEPPDGTLVVATARDRAAVLETIRSRFMILQAAPLSTAEVATVLVRGGFQGDDVALLAPLCRGAPGRAWSFARGSVANHFVAPVRAFFDPAVPLHGAIESLVKLAKDQGAASAVAREAVGPKPAVRALADLRGGGASEADDERRGETTLEAARVWIRPVVEGVAEALQELLRDSTGAPGARAGFAARVIPAAAAVRGAPADRVAQALAATVACLENVDHNLTLNLALEALALRLRSA